MPPVSAGPLALDRAVGGANASSQGVRRLRGMTMDVCYGTSGW